MSPVAKTASLLTTLLAVATVWVFVASSPDRSAHGEGPDTFPIKPASPVLPVRPGTIGRLATLTFTDKDGLPQNTVVSMAFDAQGYLWAGTFDGAVRFNGADWKIVNMPNRTLSNDVRAILPAADGALWFGTFNGGLHKFALNEWTTYVATASPLPDNQIRSLIETESADGAREIWIATLGGVARLNGTTWTVYGSESGLPSLEVWSLAELRTRDGGSSIWAGTSEGIVRFDGERWAPAGGPSDQVNYLLVDSGAGGDVTTWAATEGSGVWRYHNGVWDQFDEADGLASNSINCLFVSTAPDGSRSTLAGTTAGISSFEAGRWSTTILAGQNVRSLSQNRPATGPPMLWIGTDGSGLSYLRYGQWSVVDTASGLKNNRVSCVLETESEKDGRVYWIGTDGGGLARFEDERVTVLDIESGFASNEISALLETVSTDGKRVLWIATDSAGLIKIEAGNRTIYNKASGMINDRVWSLLETRNPDGSQTIWAGTYGGGLVRIDGDKVSVYTTRDGLPSDRIWSLAKTLGSDGAPTIWVGTASNGLARLHKGVWRTFDTSSGLPNNGIWCLHETSTSDGGRTLWVGTDGGGAAWLDLDADGKESDPVRWTVLSDASTPALPNNIVYGIQEDSRTRLYLFTNRGVARLSRDPYGNGRPELLIHVFTTEDGLPSSECTIGASYVDKKGRIWAGTVAGAAIFDPASEIPDVAPKPLLIERAALAGRGEPLIAGESLTYDANHLLFDYALLSFHRGGDTRYRTELVGLDAAPSDWIPDAKREFPALPEGSYVFRVWGKDYAGNISGPVSIEFEIRPAPWRTWWAYLGYAVLALGLVFAGVKLRLQALERRNVFLESRISERTVELADAVERMKSSQQEALDAAERAHESERQALDAAERAHESELRALEANRAKSVFLANISHELRTPLNAILGFPQVMAADKSLSAEHLDTLAIITRSGEHLLGLINDVLSISKIEAGKVSVTAHGFDLKKLLQSLEEMIRVRAQAKGLQLIVDVAPELPRYVAGDEGKLRQVLLNLLGNAVKFTDEGGVALRATWSDGHVFFEIEDTGHGIAPDEIGKLFEPFVQTESGRKSTDGTGLGLAISQNFAHLMGGAITVRSTLGRGTVFSMTLPLAASEGPEIAVEPRRVAALVPNQPEWRILITDDKVENRLLLAKILRRVGLDIREAANGREAIETWQAWRPHLIWMDVRMPVLDGITATQEILRLQAEYARESETGMADGGEEPSAVIVALTASVFEHDRDEILSAGCADFVTKPFREAIIFEKMATHLGMRFIYEDSPVSDTSKTGPATPDRLSSARCVSLPKELLVELKQSMVTGDVERANVAIDRMMEYDGQIANEIRLLVRAYRFDEVQRAVEAALADARV